MALHVTSSIDQTLNLPGNLGLKSGEILTAGDLVCIMADGYVYKADADLATGTKRPAIGVALNSYASGDYVDIADVGYVDGESALVPGDTMYLSGTAGAATQTKVAAYPQAVGVAMTASCWRLMISLGYAAGHYA